MMVMPQSDGYGSVADPTRARRGGMTLLAAPRTLQPTGTVEILAGTLANEDTIEGDLALNPFAARRLHRVRLRIDTAQSVRDRRRGDDHVVRVGLPSSFADDLRHQRVHKTYLAHLWDHWPFRGQILDQGAALLHAAFMGHLYYLDDLEDQLRDAHGLAQAQLPRAIHGVLFSSWASSTGPAGALVTPVLLRSVLSASDARSFAVALWPDLRAGTDSDRLHLRIATAWATAASLDALCVAVHDEGQVEIPGLGQLSRFPYDEVFLVSAALVGASSVEAQADSARWLLSLLADRLDGVGRAIDADAPRRGRDHFPPAQFPSARRARIFTLAPAVKVTVDRLALARRAAQWATVSFASYLLRAPEAEITPLAERWQEALGATDTDEPDLGTLDKAGEQLRPSRIDWYAPMPPKARDREALHDAAQRALATAKGRWEAECKGLLAETLQRHQAQIESERLAAGDLRALVRECDGVAALFQTLAQRLRDMANEETAAADGSFEPALAGPRGGVLGTVRFFAGIFTLRRDLEEAALGYAQAHFDALRRHQVADLLDELRLRYAERGGARADEFLTELEAQLAADGAYHRAAFSGWERLERPAPNIWRRFFTPDAFATLYFRERVLVERTSTGDRVRPEAFREAVSHLQPAIMAALGRGRKGASELLAACEAYFTHRFAERWERLYLGQEDEALEAILHEAVNWVRRDGLVERQPPASRAHTDLRAKQSDTLYVEYPADHPNREGLEGLVRGLAGDHQVCERDREDESALILVRVIAGLSLDDIVALRPGSQAHSAFLSQVEDFHAGDPDAVPVFASAWFEQLAARYDPELGEAIETGTRRRRNGPPDAAPGGPRGPRAGAMS